MVETRTEILSYFTNRIQLAKEQRLKALDLSVPWDAHPNDRLHYIPQEVFELTQLECLDLSGNEITVIPEAITQLTNLTTLDLGLNKLTAISEAITQLTNLTTLKISLNGITVIPEHIVKLTNLTTLDLGLNKLTIIPECITDLTNLTTLDLGENKLTIIPECITDLTNLTTLDLSHNALSYIPRYITQLTNLTSLDLSRNRLKSLPDFLGNLENLSDLHLSRNGMAVIPEFIGNIKNLTQLDLSHNDIMTIPDFIGELTSLDRLDLGSNKINNIPDSVSKLFNLTELNLSHNKIESICENLTKLDNLVNLDLSFNLIKEIPQYISKSSKLSKINLTGNKITIFPDFMLKLNNLATLQLSQNQIKTIPDIAYKSAKLKRLFLSQNGLKSIPQSLTSLTSLRELVLSGNEITTIPNSLSELSNLANLDLAGNKITDLPDGLWKLNELTSLDLSSNQIKTLPETIGQLTNLTSLNISENKIKAIPSTIEQLTNLKYFDLTGNRITALPNNINKLTNLILLSLDDNKIEVPPLEIVERGIKSITNYFAQLNEDQDYIYEAKLIIVGEGGVGKTTLAKKICNPNYELQSDEVSTEGINVITWKFDLPDQEERDFQVNIWDFGGQEIYHATHQFFLTKRSLYVLVADTRKEDTDFYYWLNVVELFSDNSPLLIIMNEKQERQKVINERALRGQFTNLKETLATNLQTNRGLPEILENIQDYIKKLPHIGQVLPKTWIKVREALENDTRNYISLEEYFAICEDNGFTNRENKLQLSQYLHDLGVCLHFQDQEDSILYKTVILKPGWGTDAVYKVLDSKQVINNQGCFTRDDLKDIWHESQYALMRGELLELMNKFQLCYEITDQKDTFISPQLLSENQPKYSWKSTNNLVLRYVYPEFMPKGIISRFIVVMHQYIKQREDVWKSGVILNKGATEAEVIEDYGKREIRVKVAGNSKRNFMTNIIYELDKINNLFNQRLKCRKLIPCNCQVCQSNENPYAYEFNKLLERVANRKLTIECGNPPYHEIQVLGLIDNAIDLEQFAVQQKTEKDKSFNFNGDVEQLVVQVLEHSNISGDLQIGDRNIDIDKGNYNESIQGNYLDQSRDLNISDTVQVNANDGAFSLGDISGEVINTINQLPNFDHEPEKKELKQLLRQLPSVVLATELDEEEQAESLAQIQAIAFSLSNFQDATARKTAKKAIKRLRGTAIDLPADAALVVIGNQLSDLINQIY